MMDGEDGDTQKISTGRRDEWASIWGPQKEIYSTIMTKRLKMDHLNIHRSKPKKDHGLSDWRAFACVETCGEVLLLFLCGWSVHAYGCS
jgi:hypothetical protein